MTRWYSSICWGRQWLVAKGFHDLNGVTEMNVMISFFRGYEYSIRQLEQHGSHAYTFIHIHKISINNAKIYFFLKSLREDMSRCITTSLKLTHVFAGFTKGTHQLLNLHTNYCIFLSRGQQPVNHDLAWGIWCTHRHRTHHSLLSLFHSFVIVNHQTSLFLD